MRWEHWGGAAPLPPHPAFSWLLPGLRQMAGGGVSWGKGGVEGGDPIAKQPCQHIYMWICIQKDKKNPQRTEGVKLNKPEIHRNHCRVSLSLGSDESVLDVAGSPVEFPVYTPPKGPG